MDRKIAIVGIVGVVLVIAVMLNMGLAVNIFVFLGILM